jgi:hypothetical protein
MAHPDKGNLIPLKDLKVISGAQFGGSEARRGETYPGGQHGQVIEVFAIATGALGRKASTTRTEPTIVAVIKGVGDRIGIPHPGLDGPDVWVRDVKAGTVRPDQDNGANRPGVIREVTVPDIGWKQVIDRV